MRSTIIFAIFVGVSCLLVSVPATSTHAGCEIVGCSTECWQVGPRTRRCHRRCMRRCWNDAPRYYAPEPRRQYHAPEPPYQSGPPFDPGAAVAIGLAALLIAAILAAVSSSSGGTTAREIAQIEQNSFDLHAQAHDAEQKTHTINSYIVSQEADAYQRGRRAAEREWEEYSRHD